MEKMIEKFAKHYENVDRRYGKYIAYKFNDNVFLFGQECQILKDKFNEWCDAKYGMKLHHFVGKTESGVEYIHFHISWLDDITKVLPIWFIHSEEAHYKFYQIK